MSVDIPKPLKIRHRLQWLVQCFLVFIILTLFLYIAREVLRGSSIVTLIGASSLGSTAFVAFVAHKSYMAASRRIIFSYTIAMIVGLMMFHFAVLLEHVHVMFAKKEVIYLCAAASTALFMMITTFLHYEHPPAAGLALVLVIQPWNAHLLILIFIFAVMIAGLKYGLRHWLIELV